MTTLNDDRRVFAQALIAYKFPNQASGSNTTANSNNPYTFGGNNSSFLFNSSSVNQAWQNAQAPPPSVLTMSSTTTQRTPVALFDINGRQWSSFNDAVQVFTSPYHLHSLLVNVLGFGAEICALITHLILLVYSSWQIGRRRRGRCPPDMSFGLSLHLSIVGVVLAVFTSTMHAFLLMQFEEEAWRGSVLASETLPTSYSSLSQTISPRRQQLERMSSKTSDWQMLCVYHLYIRDTLASLYLYLLVVNLAAYTKVTFPPRVPHNARWKAIFVLVHSLPWVVAIGAALPICVLNLGRGGRALPSLPPLESNFLEPPSITPPVRGMCQLNTKTDIVSTSLELFLFVLPVLLCLGIGCTICCPRKPVRASSATISAHTNHTTTEFNNDANDGSVTPLESPADSHLTHYVVYSRSILASTVLITLVTQTPFAVIRLMISLFAILKNRHPVPPILASYLAQIHLFLFASVPMLLLLAMIFLRRGYDGHTRRVEKNHVLNHDADSGEVLYTNCMLTSV